MPRKRILKNNLKQDLPQHLLLLLHIHLPSPPPLLTTRRQYEKGYQATVTKYNCHAQDQGGHRGDDGALDLLEVYALPLELDLTVTSP
jgi:hypothetical protein